MTHQWRVCSESVFYAESDARLYKKGQLLLRCCLKSGAKQSGVEARGFVSKSSGTRAMVNDVL